MRITVDLSSKDLQSAIYDYLVGHIEMDSHNIRPEDLVITTFGNYIEVEDKPKKTTCKHDSNVITVQMVI